MSFYIIEHPDKGVLLDQEGISWVPVFKGRLTDGETIRYAGYHFPSLQHALLALGKIPQPTQDECYILESPANEWKRVWSPK